MVAQGALSLTVSPLHTVDYWVKLADTFVELGAEEICLKDMAGIARPASVGKIVKGIRSRHPHIIIQYHGHSTPGFSVASALKLCTMGLILLMWAWSHYPGVQVMQICLQSMPC